MILTSSRTIVLFWLTILPCIGLLCQTHSDSHKRFAPHLAIGWSSSFYTNQFRSNNVSPKPYNARDKSGISSSIGAFRKHRSKNRSLGIVMLYFASRTRYTLEYTYSEVDSIYKDYYHINNRHNSWYIGMPITWSLLNKKKKSPFYLGITCEPLIYIMSYHNKQVENNDETISERYFDYGYSPVSMILACAVGYRYRMEKKREFLITLNNQLQVFNSFNVLFSFYKHRHNVEIGVTYSY